jgi:hypothetical protein
VLGLILFNGRSPLGEIHIGEKMLIVLGNEPAGSLVSVDDGWVDPSLLHGLDGHVFDLLGVRHVYEHGVVWAWLMPVLFDELLALFFENIDHLLGHGDRFENCAVVILFVVETLAVAAMLVFLATAAGTGGVAGQFFAGHGFPL